MRDAGAHSGVHGERILGDSPTSRVFRGSRLPVRFVFLPFPIDTSGLFSCADDLETTTDSGSVTVRPIGDTVTVHAADRLRTFPRLAVEARLCEPGSALQEFGIHRPGRCRGLGMGTILR